MADQAPAPRQGWRRYGPAWTVRPVRRAFAGTLIARAAQTMIPLTLLLAFRQRTGSFGAAGLACAPAATALTTSFGRRAHRAESFAWLAASAGLGGSAGYAAAGLLVAHAPITATILVGAALPAAAAALVPRSAAPRRARTPTPAAPRPS